MSLVDAVRIILQRLGSEALRGAVYWSTGRVVDAAISNIFAKAAQGRPLTDQEIELLRRALSQYAAQAPAATSVNIDEIAVKVVEILKKQGYIR